MTIYTVTSATYNDGAFWSAIDESSGEHLLDISDLPSEFTVSINPVVRTLSIWNGRHWYVIGEAGDTSRDACLGAAMQIAYFAAIRTAAGASFGEIPAAGAETRAPEGPGPEGALAGAVVSRGPGEPGAAPLAAAPVDALPGAPEPVQRHAEPTTTIPMVVQNIADRPVDLCRIDAAGRARRRIRLLPGECRRQDILLTDHWVLRKPAAPKRGRDHEI